MIDSKRVIELIKLKKKKIIVFDLDKNQFVEPKPGDSGNFKFLQPGELDDIIIKEVFGEKYGQNELLTLNLLEEILSKNLQPGQVQNVRKKIEQGGFIKRKKRKST